MKLKNHVALVTGGGTGIGRAVGLWLAAEGADVALMGRRPGPLERVADEVDALGVRGLALPGDVSEEHQVDRVVRETVASLGRLDIGYSIDEDVFSYADWGAATKRRRLFAVGIAKHHGVDGSALLDALTAERRPPTTVGDAIGGFSLIEPDASIDHDWPHFRTIDRYADKYATGKYGWYRLDDESPAPSVSRR